MPVIIFVVTFSPLKIIAMPHYICTNPFIKLKEDYVAELYHSESPRFFSCVRRIDLKKEKPIFFEVGPSFGFVHITPGEDVQLYFIIIDDNLNRAPWLKLQKKLKEQAQFYIDQFSHQQYKDKKEKGSWSLLRDYNASTPGLKIIHLKAYDSFIVCHERGVCNFFDEEEVFDFLSDTLQYTDGQLEKGDLNIIEFAEKADVRPFSLSE